MSDAPHVAVVGGGVSGLVAAYRLSQTRGSAGLRITLLEAEQRLGGKIRTEAFAGRMVDAGAEALLTRMPEVLELCQELGLEHELVAPATGQAYIWSDGVLRPLPPRLLAGIPGGVRSVAATGILSWRGMARAGLDVVLPSRPLEQDESIGALVRRRLGGEALERLVDPLLGGIHAGSCDELSASATAPQLTAALARGHGIVRGLRVGAASAPGARSQPVFLGLRDGLGRLIEALAAALVAADVHTGTRVCALALTPAGRIRLELDGRGPLLVDAVVLAVPAFSAAELLRVVCGPAARELASIAYASVASVLLAYPPQEPATLPPGSGFLVPRREGRLLTACTWVSAKWPRPSEQSLILKAAVGHAADTRALGLGDEQLIRRVTGELHDALALRGQPVDARVVRFERALPQYRVGHLEHVETIEAAISALPTVALAGAAYHGVGVGACVRDGQHAADRLAAVLLPVPAAA